VLLVVSFHQNMAWAVCNSDLAKAHPMPELI
jgi:hypothetical protein